MLAYGLGIGSRVSSKIFFFPIKVSFGKKQGQKMVGGGGLSSWYTPEGKHRLTEAIYPNLASGGFFSQMHATMSFSREHEP